MSEQKYIADDMVRYAVKTLKPNNEPFEIRIIKGAKIWSGYFIDADTLLDNLHRMQLERCNVYMTLQQLHSGCVARWQYEKFIEASREKLPTTSDNDIIRYRYIPIDLDPCRPAGISSNMLELEEANNVRIQVMAYMSDNGFDKYITAFSGNGYHILYPVDWERTKESEERVEQCLKRLDELFSNDACHVDTTNSNPSRIFKLYGTLAQKGRSTKERPHRMSVIEEVSL